MLDPFQVAIIKNSTAALLAKLKYLVNIEINDSWEIYTVLELIS